MMSALLHFSIFKQGKRFFLLFLCVVLVACTRPAPAEHGESERFSLTIAHINDTHARLMPVPLELTCDGIRATVSVGGFPELAAKLRQVRAREKNVLFLHAGDVFQGTVFFTYYKGAADVALLNSMALDALCPGNHEFDKGSSVLADFARKASFPLLAANIDVSKNNELRERIRPYIMRSFGQVRVGIIGVAHPDTPLLSRPDGTVLFTDPEAALRREIERLARQGVTIIIVLSHCGFERDLEIARRVEGIDVIIGGHSHTLLGSFDRVGLESGGPYPAVVKGAGGETVLVAQAWEWGKVLGILSVVFDRSGRVVGYTGRPVMLATPGRLPSGRNPDDQQEAYATYLECLCKQSQNVEAAAEDTEIKALLDVYEEPVKKMYRTVVAQVKETLVHRRCPDPDSGIQSEVAPLVAEAMLWKTRQQGLDTDIALVNAGSLSGSLHAGGLSEGRVYDLLPYTNAIVVVAMTGKDIRSTIWQGVMKGCGRNSRGGMFPYGAGIRYNLKIRGGRIIGVSNIKVKTKDGTWAPLIDGNIYKVVINEFMARGGDGYRVLKRCSAEQRPTALIDAEVFLEYVRQKETLTRPTEQTVGFVYED